MILILALFLGSLGPKNLFFKMPLTSSSSPPETWAPATSSDPSVVSILTVPSLTEPPSSSLTLVSISQFLGSFGTGMVLYSTSVARARGSSIVASLSWYRVSGTAGSLSSPR